MQLREKEGVGEERFVRRVKAMGSCITGPSGRKGEEGREGERKGGGGGGGGEEGRNEGRTDVYIVTDLTAHAQ